jgi:hypothetical protein
MITHLAVKDSDGSLWLLPICLKDESGKFLRRQCKHSDVNIYIKNILKNHAEFQRVLSNKVEGFCNEKEEFLTREEAWHEAKACGQLLHPKSPKTGKRLKKVDPTLTPKPLEVSDIC